MRYLLKIRKVSRSKVLRREVSWCRNCSANQRFNSLASWLVLTLICLSVVMSGRISHMPTYTEFLGVCYFGIGLGTMGCWIMAWISCISEINILEPTQEVHYCNLTGGNTYSVHFTMTVFPTCTSGVSHVSCTGPMCYPKVDMWHVLHWLTEPQTAKHQYS